MYNNSSSSNNDNEGKENMEVGLMSNNNINNYNNINNNNIECEGAEKVEVGLLYNINNKNNKNNTGSWVCSDRVSIYRLADRDSDT